MAEISSETLAQRRALFEAITGKSGADVSGQSGNVAGMLQTVYGTTRNGQQVVDTREAAKRLGVSQRTVQRWMSGQNKPAGDHLKALQKRSRQAVTTKRGRERAVKRSAAAQAVKGDGVRVEVSGMQGPKDYARDRRSGQKLSPDEYQALLEAYAAGGDNGALDFLQAVYSEKYVDNWEFGAVSSFRINGLSAVDRADPRAL